MARTDQTHAEHPEQPTDADNQIRFRKAVVLGVGAILVVAGAAAAIFSSGADPADASDSPIGLAAGVANTCAVDADGGVSCWGLNRYGQLGDGSFEDARLPVEVLDFGEQAEFVETGANHTCILATSGRVWCVGDDGRGQLGTSDTSEFCNATPTQAGRTPGPVPAITATPPPPPPRPCTRSPLQVEFEGASVASISVGLDHSCAVTDAGAVLCWGWNRSGQIGDGTTHDVDSPSELAGLSPDVRAVAAGNLHTCALMVDGGVKCWGANNFGQLGDGTGGGDGVDEQLTPVDVVGLNEPMAGVAAGGRHTCAWSAEGDVWCWGSNSRGQLGDGTRTSRTAPVQVMGLDGSATAVAAGGSFTCALLEAGGVQCWGLNYHGLLGDGTTEDRRTPTYVAGLRTGATLIAAGRSHACALTVADGMLCWGDNEDGQLGSGVPTQFSEPSDVGGLDIPAVAVTAGGTHTCALLEGGDPKCWGWNRWGQVGDGGECSRPCSLPSDVFGLNGVASLAAGGSYTCALAESTGVQCWGYNNRGQLGLEGAFGKRDVPGEVLGLPSGVSSVATGSSHACAVTEEGGVKCWGNNRPARLGDGGACGFRCPAPVDVNGLQSGVARVAAGDNHTCALTTAGGVKCWGVNSSGQLGDGQACGTSCSVPVDVLGLTSGVTAISAGSQFTCALTTEGAVKCWGRNHWGRLGDGTDTVRLTPVAVAGMDSGVLAVSAEGSHACAITAEHEVRCWGYNRFGQLGDGTTDDRWSPVEVVGIEQDVMAIAVGGRHSCALLADGGLSCWGWNYDGQLGNGLAGWSTIPVGVAGLGPKPTPTGDANCDGLVNAVDAALILQYKAGLFSPLPCADEADVNEDGTITSVDAALILQFTAGLLDSLPP